jgi:hypothetical protein
VPAPLEVSPLVAVVSPLLGVMVPELPTITGPPDVVPLPVLVLVPSTPLAPSTFDA